MVTRECQQFLGVGFDLRDAAMQSQALYGTGTHRSSPRPGPPLSTAQSLSRLFITGSSFFQSDLLHSFLPPFALAEPLPCGDTFPQCGGVCPPNEGCLQVGGAVCQCFAF